MIIVSLSKPVEREIQVKGAQSFRIMPNGAIDLYANAGRSYLGQILPDPDDLFVQVNVDLPLMPPVIGEGSGYREAIPSPAPRQDGEYAIDFADDSRTVVEQART